MRILFTCGGTAGHINPAIALARLFQARHRDCEVLFAGAENGMERTLVPREGYELRTVPVGTLHRSLRWKDVRHNVKTVLTLSAARREAGRILADFRPDLVVGMGGYASYPVVREAARRGIKTAVHEANASPGLTTRLLARHADLVMVGFEESRAHYPHPGRVAVTGTPVRREFFSHTRKEARRALGFSDNRPVIVSFWGSLGAEVMNRYMEDFIALECAAGVPFHHIHGAGRSCAGLSAALEGRGLDLTARPGIEVREYIYDMPVAMAAADLVLCRAGASTLAEIAALSKPAILVPSPNVTGNHQEKNARALEKHGGVAVLLEHETDGAALFRLSSALLGDSARRAAMAGALSAGGMADAAEEIYKELLALV